MESGPRGSIQGNGSPLFGQDGALSVTERDVIVNRYAALAADVKAGDRALTLRSAASLMPLGRGDLLLIYQARGATIDTSESATFGAITNLGSAGRFELVSVDSVSGDTITLAAACGLKNSYVASGAVQVVRVPQFQSLRVSQSGSITARPWDGETGGVVAMHVKEAAQIDGVIDVTGRGFRGARPDNESLPFGRNTLIIRSNDAAAGAEKGESIAGDAAIYTRLGARYGRGAPANGGGGGSSHNAAGGGGAGMDNGKRWTGHGVMDGMVTGGAMAWPLDPAYRANGNQLTDSSGGGRGGYSYAVSTVANDPDPLRVGPGDMRWGGDRRREAGGLGGRPLQSDARERLFFGGGGGAGDGNNDAAAGGGDGGGVVLLIAGAVTGGGRVQADGAPGPLTRPGHDDGGGGAGGGGAVVVQTTTLSGLTLSADGGRGGDQENGPQLLIDRECEGPGGGGGGGIVAVSQGAGNVTTTAAGGAAGVSRSPFITRFPTNGATRGAIGVARAVLAGSVPLCAPQDNVPDGGPMNGGGADLSIKITATPNPTAGEPVTYTATVNNNGPDPAKEVTVTIDLPPGTVVDTITAEGWTCKQDGAKVTCTRPSLDAGGSATIVIRTRPADGAGALDTKAHVGATTPDPDLKNNDDSINVGRSGVSYAGGGFTCSTGRGGASGTEVAALGLLALVVLRRRRR